jgi:serine protease Do
MGNLNKLTLPKILFIFIVNGILGGLVVACLFLLLPFSNTNNKKSQYSYQNQQATKIVIEESSTELSSIVKDSIECVVGIKTTYDSDSSLFFENESAVTVGSGIVISEDGFIITNSHVINNLKKNGKIEVVFQDNSSEYYIAELIGENTSKDIAVIKIDLNNLKTAKLGDSDDLEVGENIIAIGNPEGLKYMGSVTQGIISGLNRTVTITSSQNTLENLIQTDASIGTGNSGGALINMDGKVIGINTSKVTNSEYEGMSFAIPINDATEISEKLIADYNK